MKRKIVIGKSFLLLLLAFLTGAFVEVVQAQSYLPHSHFKVWDRDGNEKLTHAEFYDGLQQTALFELWDVSQDRFLVRQEFYENMGKVFPDFSASVRSEPGSYFSSLSGYFSEPEHAPSPDLESVNDALFRVADLNRNGKLNKAEFYTLIFRYLDKNENGFLTPIECRRGVVGRWFIL